MSFILRSQVMYIIKKSVVHGSHLRKTVAIASISSSRISTKLVIPPYTTRILFWEALSTTRWTVSINHLWTGIQDLSGSLHMRWPRIAVSHRAFAKIKNWLGFWRPLPEIVKMRRSSRFKCRVMLMMIWTGWFILRMIWLVSKVNMLIISCLSI